MAKYKNPYYFLLQIVPAEEDFHIFVKKLLTNKLVLLAFVVRKEMLRKKDRFNKCLNAAAT